VKVVSLLSGGLDSPVATYLLIQRGYTPVVVYCDLAPYVESANTQKVIASAQQLAKFSSSNRLTMYVLPHTAIIERIVNHAPTPFTCLLCRQAMFIGAEYVAKKEGAVAIVTGEIIGEQASQTLWNLRAVHLHLTIPILRPLITFNKDEVTQISREIGTLTSGGESTGCCTAAPDRPITHATFDELHALAMHTFEKDFLETYHEAIQIFEITPQHATPLTSTHDATLRPSG